jgi:hypothetical protein
MSDLVIRTSKCSQHDHPEFRVHYNTDLVTQDDVAFLVDSLERMVGEGARFEDGADFQIGWVANRLRADDDGTLVIQEPDMTHTPEWWIDSVNHSLIHRRLQRSVCASLVLTAGPEFPSSEQTAFVCDRFGDSNGFVMRREDAEGNHSGWVFGCDSRKHAHGDLSASTKVPLYEVAVGIEPRVIPYLALPSGISATIRPKGPSFKLRGKAIAIKTGSMIDRNFPGVGG